MASIPLKEVVIIYLPWILSLITLAQTFLTGNKHKHAWTVGLVNQLLWTIWIVVSETWGMLPMNIGLWILFYRNHLLWKFPHSPIDEGSNAIWTEITPNAPMGQTCLVINEDANVPLVSTLKASDKFFTHYKTFKPFKK